MDQWEDGREKELEEEGREGREKSKHALCYLNLFFPSQLMGLNVHQSLALQKEKPYLLVNDTEFATMLLIFC